MIPPSPKCMTHGVHHTPGKNCSISEEDQEVVDAYEAHIEAERPTWGQLRVMPLPDYHPANLEKMMELRKKIRQEERKRLEQDRHDPEGD